MTTPLLIVLAALANATMLMHVVFEPLSYRLWIRQHSKKGGKIPPANERHFLPRKPFRCIPCLTAWLAFLFAMFADQGVFSVVYIGAGYMMGCIYSAIQMRYL